MSSDSTVRTLGQSIVVQARKKLINDAGIMKWKYCIKAQFTWDAAQERLQPATEKARVTFADATVLDNIVLTRNADGFWYSTVQMSSQDKNPSSVVARAVFEYDKPSLPEAFGDNMDCPFT